MLENVGLLLYPLVLCSFFALIFIFERAIFFIRYALFAKRDTLAKLQNELSANKHLKKDIRDELIAERLFELKERFEYGIRLLRMLSIISPMIGLLGTVIGIIESFKTISTITEAVSPAIIADGLWSAMLTTAYGLGIALPCMLAAFVFARIGEKILIKYQIVLNRASLALEGVSLDD